MKKTSKGLMLVILSGVIGIGIMGCGNTETVADVEVETSVKRSKETISEKSKEDAKVEETEKEVAQLPDLYNEAAYFEALELFYEEMNAYDIEGVIDMTYYTDDKDGEMDLMTDEMAYENNLVQQAEYYEVSGMQTFMEVEEVDEGDGNTGYRAKIVFVEAKIHRDENGELMMEGDKYDSIEHISTATMAYEIEEKRWKVWDIGVMATFRVDGQNSTDWMTYLYVEEELGGWVATYGKWYNKLYPPHEGWYEDNFPNE